MRFGKLFLCYLAGAVATPIFADDLSGKVSDAEGKPMAGAMVVVLGAKPRDGLPLRSAMTYADCGRQTKTGPDGQFVMLEVEPGLLFRVAAAAEGHSAHVLDEVDPKVAGATFKVEPQTATLPPECRVRGRMVDVEGKPIAGAVVEPFGQYAGTSHVMGSLRSSGVDRYAVTNANGEFVLSCPKPFEAYDLKVQAPRCALKQFNKLPTGDDANRNRLMIDEGARVRGRLVKEGQPMPGVRVGLVHTDRSADFFAGNHEIGTDAEGKFEFACLPPQISYFIYTKMNEIQGQGAVPLDFVPVGASGTIYDLGDVAVGPAHTIAGRIVMADGSRIPASVDLNLSREGAWDYQTVVCEPNGSFLFEGVPHDESVTIAIRGLSGHRIADRTRFQQVRGAGIALHVDRPRDDIEIVLEPGAGAVRGRRGARRATR